MSITKYSDNGKIVITDKAIETVVGKSVIESYGVRKMSSQAHFQDNMKKLLKQPDYSKGIQATKDNGNLNINIYIVAPYGNKLPEIAKSIQGQVKFNLKTMLGVKPKNINIIIENVSVANDNNK